MQEPPAKRARVDSGAENASLSANIDTATITIAKDESKSGEADENGAETAGRVYQCTLKNLLPGLTEQRLAFFLKERGLNNFLACRKAPTWKHAFLAFKTAQEQREAQVMIEKHIVNMYEQPIEVAEFKMVDENIFDTRPKKGKAARKLAELEKEMLKPEWERLNDRVTPLWRIPYAGQVERKQTEMQNVVNAFMKSLENPTKTELHLLPLVESPGAARLNYRTKCEFTLGLPLQENPVPLCGFNLGNYKSGGRYVSDPSKTIHVDPFAKVIVEWVNEFIRKSPLPVYDQDVQRGFWQVLTTRTHKTDQTMVIMQVNPLGVSEEDISKSKQEFCEHMKQASDASNDKKITTLLWQLCDKDHTGFIDETPEVLFGSGHIEEQLKCLVDVAEGQEPPTFKFRISPASFFQSNTITCDYLYKVIGDWVSKPGRPFADGKAPRKRILLDLCCGTGTIGIVLSGLEGINRVIGVEMCAPAIDDAKYNAELNGIALGERLEYHCGKVEDALDAILERFKDTIQDTELVAILDPPRPGVHKRVIKAIRECPAITRLIYVSCNPRAASQNWTELCHPQPKSNKVKIGGQPFDIVRAQAVDMFPQTEHCELVLEFARGS